MPVLRDLLIDQLQDLYHAEKQLTSALPKMSKAAKNPKLKEAFDKHLVQTETHIERLKDAFSLLGEQAVARPCKAMMGLIAEGEETIEEGKQKPDMGADLALIAAAQRVEHYEISAYGTARSLARQIGDVQCARLLAHTLGDEERTDFLLTVIADPIAQQAALEGSGRADADLAGAKLPRGEREPALSRG